MKSLEKTEKNKIPLLVIVGPTASGKSDLAVQLALATKDNTGVIQAEIISGGFAAGV